MSTTDDLEKGDVVVRDDGTVWVYVGKDGGLELVIDVSESGSGVIRTGPGGLPDSDTLIKAGRAMAGKKAKRDDS